jgi:hypothetical protein
VYPTGSFTDAKHWIVVVGNNAANQAFVMGFITNTNFRIGFYGLDFYTGQTFVLNKWQHVVVTYDGSATLNTYYNGTLVATSGLNGAAPALTAGVLQMGKMVGFSEYWNGTLDDVRIYNRALSAQEVQQLYLLGK